ncbi:MAG: SCO family protein [Bacteroidetes bacterium]|nr:SCO family protein [Bacteroidota bacterium]MBS1973652.1 SCO family protein [Bacteroidota bacterium]
MKKIWVPLVALLLCILVLSKWTDSFRAFTIFSYTLQQAGTTPRDFPDIPLVDQDGKVFHIKDKHKYVLVNFVYLNCPSVCHKVNNRLEKIYHSISPEEVPSQLEFVTVSFDPKNDDIQRIKKYRSFFGTNINGWSFALPYQTGQNEFAQYLHQIGVWAYPAPGSGIINHSIYIFLVSPENKIIRIFDPAREDNLTITEKTQSCLNGRLTSSLY